MTSLVSAPTEPAIYVAGATYVAFLTQMAPDVVMGAFAGSVIFLLGVKNKPKWQWLAYFLIAFLAGLMGAPTVSDICESLFELLHIKAKLSHGLSAMFAAAVTINVISWFRDNTAVLLQRLKKGEVVE